MCTYVSAKKNAIISRISVPLFEVSSNPGVSMGTTGLPSRTNLLASWTLAVHDSKPIPIRRFEPLGRLTRVGSYTHAILTGGAGIDLCSVALAYSRKGKGL